MGLLRGVTGPADRPAPSDLTGLMALLEDGVARYADGDEPALFAPHLTEVAVELAVRRAEIPREHRNAYLQLMGLYHASRWTSLPDEVGGDDLDAARGYFGELERRAPGMVPDAFLTGEQAAAPTSTEDLETVLLQWHVAYQQAERTGHDADLRTAAAVGGRLLLCPVDDPDRGAFAALCAATSYSDLADRGDAAARDADIDAAREAVRRSGDRGEHLLDALGMLGGSLVDRHHRTGSRADLDEVIAVSGRYLQATPEHDDENLRIGHGELAECYRARAALTGSIDDLEATVRHHRVALLHTPEGHQDHPMYVVNLVSALVDRGAESGSLGHIREAAALADRLSSAGLAGERSCIRHRVVAKAFAALAFETTDPTMTERAIEHHRLSTREAHRLGDREMAAEGQVALGAALLDGFGRLLPEDLDLDGHAPVAPTIAAQVPAAARARLDEAISASRAVAGTDVPAAVRCLAQGTLALALRNRYVLDGRRGDLDEALHHAEAAMAPDDLDDARRVAGRSSLAACLRAAYAADRDPDLARRACACWRVLADEPLDGLDGRLLSALSWLETALSADLDPREALDAAECAVGLLPRLAGPGTLRADTERRLARWNHVASQAAEAALRAGRAARAVELVEQSRAVLWNALLDTRADLHEVRAVRPDLAEELAVRSAEVDDLRTAADAGADSEAFLVAGRRLEAVVAAVRENGLPRFGLPPLTADLTEHAHRGPVAVISTTSHGGRALLIGPAGVDVVDLPALILGDAVAHTARYLDALYAETPDEQALADVHEWLWHTIARPVLEEGLGAGPVARRAELPRLWWCPTGPLSLLPMHAAGSADGSVLDRVISSYTATVRSLPRRPTATSPMREALFVGMSRSPGAADLVGVGRERESLQRVMGPDAVALLEDERADRASVSREWTQHPVIHFSGHGAQLSDSPSNGGLLLHLASTASWRGYCSCLPPPVRVLVLGVVDALVVAAEADGRAVSRLAPLGVLPQRRPAAGRRLGPAEPAGGLSRSSARAVPAGSFSRRSSRAAARRGRPASPAPG